MKELFAILSIVMFVAKGNAQTENINSGKYHPAKEHFETEYRKQEYPQYSRSQIKVEKDRIVIDIVKVIEFSKYLDERFKLIFANGLLDPVRINGNPVLKITDMDELLLLNPNPQTKRFKFWSFPQNKNAEKDSIEYLLRGKVNPNEYYFELQNENADENTGFKEFVEGAKLSYLAYGGIIL
ncbi:hypothetical protein ACM46_15760 [Chryseobacterium angstadtii]|uniref:Uncharacterized protein n=1 Tax=Chryseobacterium angstadtii TaxID=558151 RepID=A0A0J7I541_9FLAO|nr:hypothetical protein [Chryseobacterium angstadtii]KMQ61472.1 hypothetical protein ACM46_15760 [Chryseobacterium angstadtii]